MDSIGIALIAYGMIGRVHSLAHRELPIFYPGGLPRPRPAGVCTGRPKTAQAPAAAARHRSLILDTLHEGKHDRCEKPLALDGAEARALVAARIRGPRR